MGKKLLIVESPAKAKTIGKYLGGDFTVKSSVGHIRDLPKSNGAIKITPDGDGKWKFEPKYEIPDEKKKVVGELKDAVKDVDEIYLASDPDREGEAIAWHLKEVLSRTAGGKPFRRVTYNEITKSAVLKAVAEPRDIDMPRVDAQQARRILDRLVGYRVSPLLWKYVQCANNRTLSAGRVQSVALRLLVERQREIDAFTPVTYFLLGAEAKKRNGKATFTTRLAKIDGKKPEIANRQTADGFLLDLSGASLETVSVKAQPRTRHPLPPFTTSTLQQAASSVLGMSPGKTMKIAQALYEEGLITYMRTDSVNISEDARAAAKNHIVSAYGPEFYPETPNFYKSKADAQGAHEAIRPTDVNMIPAATSLDGQAAKVYDLVWRRFVASQMADAKTTLRTAVFEARKGALVHAYEFTASATEIDFEGFLKVMKLKAKPKKSDDDDDDGDEVAALPPLKEGEELDVVRWISDEKQTKGPKAYSEASLVKALEENGVGRPSTYAATIETLKTREYAKTEKTKMTPLERGVLVCDWLVKKLDSLFNVGYTAEMEAELDKVEENAASMDSMLSDFYSKFQTALKACAEPPPDREKFDVVFGLLSKVKEWKEPKKVGKRVYDDKAFFESVREQAESDRSLSARQLEFLVRMAMSYASQIPDAEIILREHGLSASPEPPKAEASLARVCFDAIDRLKDYKPNTFMLSLRDQFERGRDLSEKQFSIVAQTVLEKGQNLPDYEDLKTKLGGFVQKSRLTTKFNDMIPELFELLSGVTGWRKPGQKGKRKFDDKSFVESLQEQFRARNALSEKQYQALRHLAIIYRDKIPNFRDKAEALGLATK